RLIESRHIIHVRRPDQSAIECVRPCVIWTLNRSGQLSISAFGESTTAVAAHVIKSTNFSAFIADNDQAFVGDLRDKVIPGLGDCALMSHQHPLPRENSLLLLREDLRRDEVPLRQ